MHSSVNKMNLQQVLNYRTTCFIHNKLMIPFCTGLTVFNVDNGLLLKPKIKKEIISLLTFNLDGTYSHDPKFAKPKIPFTFYMNCEECAKFPIQTKTKSFGATTLMEVRQRTHYYTFSIISKDDNTFNCQLGVEVIRYHNDNKFYHMRSNLETGATQFKLGSCVNADLLDQLMNSLMHLDVPKCDTTKITSLEQMIDKIKLYNLFS